MPRRKDPEDLDVLGLLIRKARNRLGLTQTTFAPLVGLNQSEVSAIECGARSIPAKAISRWSKALRVPVSKLVIAIEARAAAHESPPSPAFEDEPTELAS